MDKMQDRYRLISTTQKNTNNDDFRNWLDRLQMLGAIKEK